MLTFMTFWDLLEFLGLLGIPWDSLGFPGPPWDSLGFPGIPWIPWDSLGLPGNSLVLPGIPWGSLGFPGILGEFLELPSSLALDFFLGLPYLVAALFISPVTCL